LAIGLDPSPGDEFVSPTVVGVDSDGGIYVYDRRLAELSRYDMTGRFQNVVAKEGDGPGGFRSPSGFGVDSDSIWIAENHTDRVQWVSPDGEVLQVIHTGFRAGRLGFSSLAPVGFSEGGDLLLVGVSELQARPGLFGPPLIWRYLTVDRDGETLDTVYEYQRPSRTILLHGGKTYVGYPGPDDAPIVSFRPRGNRILRIERPVPNSRERAEISLALITKEGVVIRSRTLDVEPVKLPEEVRDSLWARLVQSATLGGNVALDRATEKELNKVASWPEWYPPVGKFAVGPEGDLWLERLGAHRQGSTEWLVVDSMFHLVARAFLPPGVTRFGFFGGKAWVSLADSLGIPYVARIEFRELTDRGSV
jgi:hypothetical protein